MHQLRSRHKRALIIITALAGITGCLADLGGTIILGNRIDGYQQLKHTISQMGILSSPVAHEIALCWIGMGILLIIFAVGFRYVYENSKKLAGIASVLVILYGIGEGLVSGVFPADKAGEVHTWTGLVHDGIGGIGVMAIMVFPLVMRKVIPDLMKVSIIFFLIGAAGVMLFFISRIVVAPDNFLAVYKGSWQRLYVLDYYGYIMIIAVRMMCRRDH